MASSLRPAPRTWPGPRALADAVKKLAPECKILFVGGHVAALPREVLEKHPAIDFVCQNEGVYTISNLLKTNLKDGLDASGWFGFPLRRGGIVLNKPSPIVAQGDLPRELPGIAWDLLPVANYRTSLVAFLFE